jgi:two-component system OmpR family response regulator
MRILIVEDEQKMAALLRRGLHRHGYAADVARDAATALGLAATTAYDAILLDLGLPDTDGVELCRRLRDGGSAVPVLMVTARDGVFDRVAGLDAGADDYLVKPFAFAELLARLRALQRRSGDVRPSVLEAAGLRLDPAARRVTRGGTEIGLTATEFALLEALMRRPGDVLERDTLLERAWDIAYDSRSNVVDVYVRRLRAKLDAPFGTDSIETVRGVGYRLRSGAAT